MIETVHVDDLTVARARPQRATRDPVLFVHGYFADARLWIDWLQRFASRGTPAYAVNLRGRSGSRPGTDLGHSSVDDFVADAACVVRELGAPAVVGHSMGGLIAQRLAADGAVRAAVLVTPAPPRGITVLSPRLLMKQLKYLPDIVRSRLVHPAREDLRELVLNRVPAGRQESVLDLLGPDSGRAARDMSITGVPVDARRVRCPLLVIAAEDDRFIPRPIVERIARRYRAPLRTMNGHGHMVVLEPGWEELADSVLRWIDDRMS
jgi:pimeloyl-ACP methyl ester carboxylesterase